MIGDGTFSLIFLVENGKTHEKYALKKMKTKKMEDLEEKKKKRI
jgi:serine/threonine protein kinase